MPLPIHHQAAELGNGTHAPPAEEKKVCRLESPMWNSMILVRFGKNHHHQAAELSGSVVHG